MRKILSISLAALSLGGCAMETDTIDNNEPIRSVAQEAVSADVFDCKEKDGAEGLLCEIILARVNSELDSAGITIDREGILYTYDDPNDQKIDTGHSCSVTAEVQHKHAEARISSDSRLDVSGDALREPFAIKVSVPVSLSASVRVKQRFGARVLFGGCSNYGSDSYTFNGSLSTRAELLAGFALNPSFGVTSDGDLAIMLHPQAAVASELKNTNINFSVSGVSPITPAWTFVAGFSSTLGRATQAAFQGDSVSDVFKATAAWDFGVPLGLSILGGPAQDIVWGLVEKKVERAASRKAKFFGSELEDKLNDKLRKALRTDTSGVRTFIIDRDYAALLAAGGVLDDVLLSVPIDARAQCHASLQSMCNSCRGCSACAEAHRRCDTIPSVSVTETSPIPTRPVAEPEPEVPSGSGPVPSGSACTWQEFTGAGGSWGSVRVARPVGACSHSYREIYYGSTGAYERTVYK